MLTITGLALTGEQEIRRLSNAGIRVSEYAKFCLRSLQDDGYDRNHRLVAGQEYNIVLMPTKEIKLDDDRTTDALRACGIRKYGYAEPFAGIIPRVREIVSDEQMEEMGFRHIVAPHKPITGPDVSDSLLGMHRNGDGRWLGVRCGCSSVRWSDTEAFAFFAPACD